MPLCLTVFGAAAQADDADDAALLAFYADQGCAIGPATNAAAKDAGFSIEQIDRFADAARNNPTNTTTGDWVVLSPAICRIELPKIVSQISMSDPEVVEGLSKIAEFAPEDPGCFIESSILFKQLQERCGWSKDQVNHEYLRFLVASILSGELSFFSDSPLRTPPGIIYTQGECADVAQIPVILAEHALWTKHFDALIRANAKHIKCEPGASGLTPALPEITSTTYAQQTQNAWLGIELQFVAMGAGWFGEGDLSRNSVPRPPFCHFD
ncbi:cyclin family protein [Halovulum sp. GXIMD14793]